LTIPDKLKIGGLTLDVVYKKIVADRNNFGEMSFMNQTITIDPDIKQDKREDTFLHEILEAINHYYCIGLEHDNLTVLGRVLYQVLRDNEIDFRGVRP